MANTRYSQPQSTQRYTQIYDVFRGVDFANNPVNCDPSRSPWSVNIMPDAGGYPSKRYGWRTIDKPSSATDPKINGMYFFAPANDPDGHKYVIVHAAGLLYAYIYADKTLTYSGIIGGAGLKNDYSTGFQHKNSLYILDGQKYIVVRYEDENNAYVAREVSSVATAPITQDCGYYEAVPQGTDPETYEYVWHYGELTKPNLLTARRINTFAGDGENKVFWFDTANFRVEKVEVYTAASGTSTSGKYVKITAEGNTNIRDYPSQSNSNVIGTAPQNTTYPYLGTYNSKWYTISYNGRTAYVHTSRSTVVDSGGSSTTEVTDAEWQEITSGYSVAEDNAKHRTKITFNDAPAAHPDGSGIASIRVTGIVTQNERYEQTGYDGVITLDHALAVISVTVAGSAATYTFDADDREVTITSSVGANDKVVIEYLRKNNENENIINGCRFFGTFGAYNNDIFFFSGNSKHPNRDWASESDDPTLFREDSWTDIGNEANPIMGYMTYQSAQIIVKASNDESGAIYRRTSQTLSDGNVIFPVKQSFAGAGAVSEHAFAQLRDAPLYLTANGVYGFISSDLASRYSVQEKSYLVNPKLMKETLNRGVGVAWKNLYLLCFPDTRHCYVADGGQMTAPSNTERAGYEWYYWDHIPARVFLVVDDILFFGMPQGYIARFNEARVDQVESTPTAISAIWSTSAHQLYVNTRLKFIERRGCILHLSNDATTLKVAVITDASRLQANENYDIDPADDTNEYDVLDLHADTGSPHICLNRPIKRFDYVQFVFKNDNANEGLGIYSLEYQYRYGRVIK